MFSLGVLAAGWLLLHVAARALVMDGLHAVTGLDTQLGALRWNVWSARAELRELRVWNPDGYGERLLAHVPELIIDARLARLAQGQAHIEYLKLHVEELRVVKSAGGRVNVRAIRSLPGTTSPRELPPFHIDVLDLRVSRVTYLDETVTPPFARVFDVNLHERFAGVHDASAFTGLVVGRALMRTTVGQLAQLDMRGLHAAVTETLRVSAVGLGETIGHRTSQLGRGTLGTALDAVQSLGESIKDLFQ